MQPQPLPAHFTQSLPSGARSLSELVERAGTQNPKYQPLVCLVEPSSRAGWLRVHVSLAPGHRVVLNVPERRYSPETVSAILTAAPALYAPAGLTSNLWAPE